MQPVISMQMSLIRSSLSHERWRAIANTRESLLGDEYVSYMTFDKGIKKGYYGDGVVADNSSDEDDERSGRRGLRKGSASSNRTASTKSVNANTNVSSPVVPGGGASAGGSVLRRKDSSNSLRGDGGEEGRGRLKRQSSNSSIGSGKGSGGNRRKSKANMILDIPPPLGLLSLATMPHNKL
jgi:hypothetical protein